MEPEHLVVLYSKYSHQCQKILQVYDKSTMDYIKLVCIDNAQCRERLLSSKSIQVQTVPCVLLIYENGKIEKFEGNNVTQWILDQISKNLPYTEERTELGNTSLENIPLGNIPLGNTPLEISHTPIENLPLGNTPLEISHTPIENLPIGNPLGSHLGNIENLPIQKPLENIEPPRQKSISELAAEMAKERDDVDRPAYIQMQEMQLGAN